MNENNYLRKTEYGNIMLTKHAIGMMVVDKVKEFKGKVMISNHKGKVMGFVGRLSRIDDVDNIEITFDESGAVSIKMYIIIRFGTSITKTTNALIENIHNCIKTVTGREPISISIVVAGIISKNIAKRNIEVSKRYGD